MKVKKLADGTIQFQKDERDYEDVVYTVFFETNLLLLGLKKEDTSETVQFFYSMDTDKKYGTVHLPEDQKRFDAGEVLTLYPMDMKMDDYEVLCNEKLMFEMSGGQVMDAFSINEKSFVLCPYVVVPHKEKPSFKCLVFDYEMNPVDGYADVCGDNPFTVMKRVMEKLGLDEESSVSRIETTSALMRARYRKWFYTYGSSNQFPFQSGWTEVLATDAKRANQTFRGVHPDVTPGYLNCAYMYSQDEFPMSMASAGNYGSWTQETLIAR
jgi:hypothetical protein